MQPYVVPVGEGNCNFTGEAMMFKPLTATVKHVFADGKGTLFRKLETCGKDLTGYKFCYRVEGRHPNAKADSVYLVMANERDIHFDRVSKYFFSARLEDHMLDAHIVPISLTEDSWGLRMYTKDVTATGCKIAFDQLGGNPTGSLQTGAWYKLEKYTDGKWADAPSEIPEEQRVMSKNPATL